MIRNMISEKEKRYKESLRKKLIQIPSFEETAKIIYHKLVSYAKSRRNQGFRHGMFIIVGGYDVIARSSYQLNKDSKLYREWMFLCNPKEDLNKLFFKNEEKEGAFLITKSGFLYAEQQHILTHHHYKNIEYARLGNYQNLNELLKLKGEAGTKTSTAMLLTKISDAYTITLGSCSGNQPFEERKLRMFKNGELVKSDIIRDGNMDQLSKGLRYFLTTRKKYSNFSFS